MTAARPVRPMSTTAPSPDPSTASGPSGVAAPLPSLTSVGPVASTAEADRPAAVAAQAGAPECSVRPAPRRDPAFDDEPPARPLRLVRACATPELPFPSTPSLPKTPDFPTAASLPTQPSSPTAARTEPASPRRLTLVPALAPAAVAVRTAPAETATAAPAPAATKVPAPTRSHPDPARFGRQFVQGAIEALSGRRPMVQLTRHVSPAVQRGLARAGGDHPLTGATAPVLHSLHLSEPADGVCEMSAIVVVGPRYRALAARLEWKTDHWRCTALQLG